MSKAATVDVPDATRAWPATVLRGVGQVMFQEHAITGALFLIGIAIASPWMCLGAIVGAIIGPLVARALKVDHQQIAAGLYGFNSALVGIALVFYLELQLLTWILIASGAAVAAIVTWICRRGVPFAVYTAPFVVVTWGCLVLAADLRRPPASPSHTPVNFVASVLAGEAEVMFGASILTGVCFLLGIAISNPRHAAAALAGSVVGTLVATYRHDPESAIWIGLYGYNASLASMAAYLARPGLIAPLLAAIISVPIVDWADAAWSMPALTAPFVLATWLVVLLLAMERSFSLGQDHS